MTFPFTFCREISFKSCQNLILIKFELQAILAQILHIFETVGHLTLTTDVDDDIHSVLSPNFKGWWKGDLFGIPYHELARNSLK